MRSNGNKEHVKKRRTLTVGIRGGRSGRNCFNLKGMDKRFSNMVFGFLGSAVLAGTITNFIVAISFSGGDFVNTILFCQVSNNCMPRDVFWGTVLVAILSYLVALVFDFVRWINIIKKVNVHVPESPSDNLEILIENQNTTDLLGVNISPRFIKEKTWHSRLNVTRGLDNCSFVLNHKGVRGKTNIKEILVEPSMYDGIDYPLTKFQIGEKGHFYKNYFPFDVNERPSTDSEKRKGDLYIAIFEIVIELEGKIGAGKFSRLFYGKFSHALTVYKYEKKKHRGSLRWVKCKPKYVSNMQWLIFEEICSKKLEEVVEKNNAREKNKDAKLEIQTKDDLIKEL